MKRSRRQKPLHGSRAAAAASALWAPHRRHRHHHRHSCGHYQGHLYCPRSQPRQMLTRALRAFTWASSPDRACAVTRTSESGRERIKGPRAGAAGHGELSALILASRRRQYSPSSTVYFFGMSFSLVSSCKEAIPHLLSFWDWGTRADTVLELCAKQERSSQSSLRDAPRKPETRTILSLLDRYCGCSSVAFCFPFLTFRCCIGFVH